MNISKLICVVLKHLFSIKITLPKIKVNRNRQANKSLELAPIRLKQRIDINRSVDAITHVQKKSEIKGKIIQCIVLGGDTERRISFRTNFPKFKNEVKLK